MSLKSLARQKILSHNTRVSVIQIEEELSAINGLSLKCVIPLPRMLLPYLVMHKYLAETAEKVSMKRSQPRYVSIVLQVPTKIRIITLKMIRKQFMNAKHVQLAMPRLILWSTMTLKLFLPFSKSTALSLEMMAHKATLQDKEPAIQFMDGGQLNSRTSLFQ